MIFSRSHHQRIAKALESLNGDLLKAHNCLFAGGTAIALRYGEYRESVGIDFFGLVIIEHTNEQILYGETYDMLTEL